MMMSQLWRSRIFYFLESPVASPGFYYSPHGGLVAIKKVASTTMLDYLIGHPLHSG